MNTHEHTHTNVHSANIDRKYTSRHAGFECCCVTFFFACEHTTQKNLLSAAAAAACIGNTLLFWLLRFKSCTYTHICDRLHDRQPNVRAYKYEHRLQMIKRPMCFFVFLSLFFLLLSIETRYMSSSSHIDSAMIVQ